MNSFPAHQHTFLHQRQRKKGPGGSSGRGFLCFVLLFFNLQPNCVKCSQGRVRREIVVVALTHGSTARVAGGPHPSLASKGGQTAAAVLQEPPSSSRLGCLEAQLQKAAVAARHRPAPRHQHAPGSSAGGSWSKHTSRGMSVWKHLQPAHLWASES